MDSAEIAGLCCGSLIALLLFAVFVVVNSFLRNAPPMPPDVKFTGAVDGVPIQYAGYDSQPSVVFSIDQGDGKALRGLMRERVEVEIRRVDD